MARPVGVAQGAPQLPYQPPSRLRQGIGCAMSLIGLMGIVLTAVYFNRLERTVRSLAIVGSVVLTTAGVGAGILRCQRPLPPQAAPPWIIDESRVHLYNPILGAANRPPFGLNRISDINNMRSHLAQRMPAHIFAQPQDKVQLFNLSSPKEVTPAEAQAILAALLQTAPGSELNVGDPLFFRGPGEAAHEDRLAPASVVDSFLKAYRALNPGHSLLLYSEDPQAMGPLDPALTAPRHLRFIRPVPGTPCASINADRLTRWNAWMNVRPPSRPVFTILSEPPPGNAPCLGTGRRPELPFNPLRRWTGTFRNGTDLEQIVAQVESGQRFEYEVLDPHLTKDEVVKALRVLQAKCDGGSELSFRNIPHVDSAWQILQAAGVLGMMSANPPTDILAYSEDQDCRGVNPNGRALRAWPNCLRFYRPVPGVPCVAFSSGKLYELLHNITQTPLPYTLERPKETTPEKAQTLLLAFLRTAPGAELNVGDPHFLGSACEPGEADDKLASAPVVAGFLNAYRTLNASADLQLYSDDARAMGPLNSITAPRHLRFTRPFPGTPCESISADRLARWHSCLGLTS